MKLRVEFTSANFSSPHTNPLAEAGTLQRICSTQRWAGDCTPTEDSYLRTTYIAVGGAHKPPLIQMAALKAMINEMFAFLMVEARFNSPSWILNQALLAYVPSMD